MSDDKVFNIGIIGSGQGGGRICEAFYKMGYTNALAINTAPQDLKHLSLEDGQKLLVDTGKQGAGKDPSISNSAYTQNEAEILAAIADSLGEVDRIFICASAGGGTGTGSCIPLIEIAHRYIKSLGIQHPEKKVGVIFSIPTVGECRSRAVAKNAHGLLTEISTLASKKKISPAIIVENEKIKKVFPGLTMREFWPKSNSSISSMFDCFNTIPLQDSLFSSFDPADFENVMESHGFMTIGGTTITDDLSAENISEAFEKNLKNTIISSGYKLSDSKSGACIITVSEDVVDNVPGLMDEIDEAMDKISKRMNADYIHRGIYATDQEGLTVYSMISGLPTPYHASQSLSKLMR